MYVCWAEGEGVTRTTFEDVQSVKSSSVKSTRSMSGGIFTYTTDLLTLYHEFYNVVCKPVTHVHWLACT